MKRATAIRLLHGRRIRRQPVRALVAMGSVAVGVTLAVAVVVVHSSTDRSMRDAGRRLAGPAPLRVVGPSPRGGLHEAAVDRVRSVPGVALAVPAVQAITVVSQPGRSDRFVVALGLDCGVPGPVTCPGGEGPWPSRSLARSTAPGSVLRTDRGDLPLANTTPLAELDGLGGDRVVAMPLATAQERFARGDAVDVVYVAPAEGADPDRLRREMGRAVGPWAMVLDADDPAPGIGLATGVVLPLIGLLSLFALVVGAVLVRNTVVLALAQRRRELAIISALGASPRLIVAGTVAEAAVLGAAGGLLGALGAVALAGPLLAAVSETTERVTGIGLELQTPWIAPALAVALGAAVSAMAAWPPARRAAGIDVAAELSGRHLAEDASPRLAIRGAVMAAAVAASALALSHVAQRDGGLEPWQAAAGPAAFVVGAFALIAAVGAIAPAVFRGAARLGTRRMPAVVRLGLENLVRVPGRTRVMVVAAAAAVGIACAIDGVSMSVRDVISENVISGTADGVVVSTQPLNNTVNVDARLDRAAVDRLEQLPGVMAVERRASVLVSEPGRTIGVQGLEGARRPGVLNQPVVRGVADGEGLDRGDVVIGAGLARASGVRPGGTLRVPARGGFVWLRVQGIWQDAEFNGMTITMSLRHLEALWGPQPPLLAIVRSAPGTSPAVLAERIRAAGLPGDVRVHTAAALAQEVNRDNQRLLTPFRALQRGMLLVAFAAVLFSLLLAAVQRQREMAVLSAIGMRPRDLAQMVLVEGVAVGVAAAALAAVASIGFVQGMRDVLTIVVGYRQPFRFDWLSPLRTGALTVVVLAAAAAWPAVRSARIEIADALRLD